MDQQLLQRTRYLLQTRFRKIQTAQTGNFELVVKQVLNWLEGHPLIGAVIQHLDQVPGNHHAEIQLLLSSKLNGSRYHRLTVSRSPKQEHEPEFHGYTPVNDREHASACLQIIRATVQRPNIGFYCLLAVYLTQEDFDEMHGRDKNPVDAIKDIAVRDLYEYLDEHLDGVNAINGLLRKYKQSVEWFQQEQIQRALQDGYGGRTGERALAVHLQQYVFDQSVEFVVEPSSRSGETDLLLRDPSGQYTIIDAKLIKRGASQSEIVRKIAAGFNQVYRYCNDYSQPEGFLAVFVDDDISILLDVEQGDIFRYFKVGGHIVYLIEINVVERPSASKSGKIRQIHITKDMLTEQIENAE
jgi:hypothetical protein